MNTPKKILKGFFYTVDEHQTLCDQLPENEFIEATEILWDSRMIKSQEEVEVTAGIGWTVANTANTPNGAATNERLREGTRDSPAGCG